MSDIEQTCDPLISARRKSLHCLADNYKIFGLQTAEESVASFQLMNVSSGMQRLENTVPS